MRILAVEDDYLQAEHVVRGLKRAFPRASVDLLRTESDFCWHLQNIERNPPDVVVMDIMLRWADPNPEMPSRPNNIKEEGFYRAGFRCRDLLAQNERTRNIPVILYTILERKDIETASPDSMGATIYVRKDAELDPLIRKIRECAQGRTTLTNRSPVK